ncbi:MAG: bgl, partial [Cyanobacteria bacterium RYN_339]|nr:bgl [Cyanobacteria bacterium RYN_339]
ARTLENYYHDFHLPILVAENGFATHEGQPRKDGWTRENYLVAHAEALESARRRGIPVMGYMHWTLTDNWEWGTYGSRFGLWSVDIRHGDYTRRETPAVAVYREIVRHDGATPELRKAFPPPR